ncbi:helix-turn-helix transcriptional regulator [Amycolatopsis acidicola]|uniref:Helix-turn-helix transcriptional regulator n=1 Tax=Amycolatopsis acidicola TaxID=2596893 RepID=A0A5N0V313_9PSEU|nr:LuxR family transcriptional regulator [Amycolatopsis acidicola]KAA9159087.1 helix-turn-helix transcriptional regulator [Amycolatopsis acidicola]
MDDDASPARATERLIGLRLRQFQRVTGLPTVFGGATAGRSQSHELRIAHQRGTIGDSLLDLRVASGRGLGGWALASGRLRTVSDYASTPAITHDFDEIVVRQERLSAIVALPIKVGGAVGGIIYGAVRGGHRIGRTILDHAAAFGATLERELAELPAPEPALPHTQAAVGELAELARTTGDETLRRRLEHLISDLRGITELRRPGTEVPPLAPREREVLELIAVGMTNADAAHTLGLSTETVRAYLRSAMRKLGVGNRTAAVHAARRLGLL